MHMYACIRTRGTSSRECGTHAELLLYAGKKGSVKHLHARARHTHTDTPQPNSLSHTPAAALVVFEQVAYTCACAASWVQPSEF